MNFTFDKAIAEARAQRIRQESEAQQKAAQYTIKRSNHLKVVNTAAAVTTVPVTDKPLRKVVSQATDVAAIVTILFASAGVIATVFNTAQHLIA